MASSAMGCTVCTFPIDGDRCTVCDFPRPRPLSLTERVATVKAELARLQCEVEDLPAFLGSFHAVNGLRQAEASVGDCLRRLDPSVSE